MAALRVPRWQLWLEKPAVSRSLHAAIVGRRSEPNGWLGGGGRGGGGRRSSGDGVVARAAAAAAAAAAAHGDAALSASAAEVTLEPDTQWQMACPPLQQQQQQQQQQRRRRRRADALPDPALSAAVRACATWRACAALLDAEGARLDAMLISALITRTVRAVQEEDEDLLHPLFTGGAAASAAGAAVVSGGAAAVASAARRADLDAYLSRLAALALRRLPGFRPQQFANVLWGLARLGHRPPPAWMDAYLAAAEERLVVFRPPDLARLMWALGALKFLPARGWLGAFLAESGDKLGGFSARDLANTLWGLAALRAAPPPDWLRDAALAMEQHFAYGRAAAGAASWPAEEAGLCGGGSSGGGVGGVGGSASYEPGASGAAGWRRQAPFRPDELSIACWALARLGHEPSAWWVDAVASTAALMAPAMGPQEAANTLWALQRWRARAPPPPRALAAIFDAALSALHAAAPPDGHALAVALASAARLGAAVGRRQARRVLLLVDAMWARLTTRQLAMAAAAVATMRLPQPPPCEWVAALEAASLTRLADGGGGGSSSSGSSGTNATDAAQLAWTMRELGWRPADRWWAALYATLARGAAAAASGAELATLLNSAAALRAPPPPAGVMRLVWQRLSTLLQLDESTVDDVLTGPAAAQQQQQQQEQARKPAVAPGEAAAILWASARFAMRPVEREERAAAAAAPAQAALSAPSPAAAPPPPPPALLPPLHLLIALAELVAAGLSALSDGKLLRTAWAVGKLRLARVAAARGRAVCDALAAEGWKRQRALVGVPQTSEVRWRMRRVLERLLGRGARRVLRGGELLPAALFEA